MKTYKGLEYIQNITARFSPELGFSEENNFSLWQSTARKKLGELLGLPLEKCDDEFKITAEKVKDGYIQKDFEFQSEKGYFVSASVLIPNSLQGKAAGMICLQGHSTGMHISLGEAKFEGDKNSIAGGRDFAVQAVKNGYCAFAIDQRYMGRSGQNEHGSPSCISTNTAMAALLLGRSAIGERVWDISRLIDVIEKHFSECVDMERIACMGNSGGGTATFYASCMDERIKLSIPSCSVCTYEASIMAMYHCPCNFIPGVRKYFNMGDLGGLIAPRRLIVVAGSDDNIFPIDGVKESFGIISRAYKASGKADNCTLVVGNGGHQFYPNDVWPIVKNDIKF